MLVFSGVVVALVLVVRSGRGSFSYLLISHHAPCNVNVQQCAMPVLRLLYPLPLSCTVECPPPLLRPCVLLVLCVLAPTGRFARSEAFNLRYCT